MERWHLTLLLSVAAVAGVALSPALRPSSRPATPASEPLVIPEATASSGPLRLEANLDRSAVQRGQDGRRDLVVTVTAPDSDAERVPVDIAMVVDTSGSMGTQGKIEAARTAADELVDALRPGDRFALVSFDDRARLLAPGTTYEGDATRLHELVASLRDDGGTNLWDGLVAGRTEVRRDLPARKVLLVSDGNANVGETDPAAFARLARGYAADGVTVSAIGLGRDFNETLLEGMADAGGGSYRFVGEPEELPAVIAAELERTTQTVAKQTRLSIRLAPGVRLNQVYGWSTESVGDATEVYIGDISAGQTRKVVLSVDVPPDTVGDVAVATSTLSYSPVGGGTGSASVETMARVTEYGADVERSRNEGATVAATRARVSVLTSASAAAYRRGDQAQAQTYLRDASGVIAEALDDYDAPALREDKARTEQLQSLGYTEGGSYAAKAAGEAARDQALY